MPAFDPQPAIALLQGNAAQFGPDAATRDAYIAEAMARLESEDDKREATKLAVEAAKMFLTIALAVLVATGPWVQYLHTTGVPWASKTMAAFYIAALALIVSIGCGFHVISKVFKRAEGRPRPVSPPWSTEPVKRALNGQAAGGIVAIAALLVGLFLWAAAGDIPPTALSITIPGTTGLASAGPLAVEGEWTSLVIKTKTQQTVTLPAGRQSFSINCQ